MIIFVGMNNAQRHHGALSSDAALTICHVWKSLSVRDKSLSAGAKMTQIRWDAAVSSVY
jgi:hypothetical protein